MVVKYPKLMIKKKKVSGKKPEQTITVDVQ